MNVEGMMKSEIVQVEKDIYRIISLTGEIFKKKKTSEYYRKKQTHRYREHTSGY